MEYCEIYKWLIQWLPVIKDIVITIAAIITMGLAIYGVVKWRIEHKGKTGIDVARELLASVYSVRNNFEIVRSPFLSASEFPEGYNPLEITDKEKADATWYVYKNRLAPLSQAMTELDVALIQGEVLWGEEAKKEGRMLNRSFNMLVHSIKEYIYLEEQGIENPRDETVLNYRKDIAASRDSEDELSKQIKDSINYFEKLLTPYVRQKNN